MAEWMNRSEQITKSTHIDGITRTESTDEPNRKSLETLYFGISANYCAKFFNVLCTVQRHKSNEMEGGKVVVFIGAGARYNISFFIIHINIPNALFEKWKTVRGIAADGGSSRDPAQWNIASNYLLSIDNIVRTRKWDGLQRSVVRSSLSHSMQWHGSEIHFSSWLLWVHT